MVWFKTGFNISISTYVKSYVSWVVIGLKDGGRAEGAMGRKRRGRVRWIFAGLSLDSIEFQTLRDLQTFNIKQINQLCRRIIPLG